MNSAVTVSCALTIARVRAGPRVAQRLGAGRNHQIAAEHQSAAPAAMRAPRAMLSGSPAMRTWRHDRAALLRQPGLVEHDDAVPVEMRRHAEQRADRDHAGAADAGEQDAAGPPAMSGRPGCGSSSVAAAFAAAGAGLRRLPPSTVTKLGQKPPTQEKSLLQEDWSIARLVPNSVSTGTTERQLDLRGAVAAPLAHRLVDEGARAGSAIVPRLRRRRFSEAQVCS